MLQLLLKKLILKPHIFQLLLHLTLLFGQLVLPLQLLSKLFLLLLQLLLLKFLLIASALGQSRTRRSGTWICLLGKNRRRKSSKG